MKFCSIIPLIAIILLFGSCESPREKVDKVEEKVVTAVEEVIDDEIDVIDDFEEFIEDESEHCTVYSKLRTSRNLRDPNKMHIKTGREVGMHEPFRKNADFLAVRDSLLQCGKLQFVDDGLFYRKKRMKHSYPYLTPEAINLLQEISVRFNENLKKKKITGIFIATHLVSQNHGESKRTSKEKQKCYPRHLKSRLRCLIRHLLLGVLPQQGRTTLSTKIFAKHSF